MLLSCALVRQPITEELRLPPFIRLAQRSLSRTRDRQLAPTRLGQFAFMATEEAHQQSC
jgi:hypothetical protein